MMATVYQDDNFMPAANPSAMKHRIKSALILRRNQRQPNKKEMEIKMAKGVSFFMAPTAR